VTIGETTKGGGRLPLLSLAGARNGAALDKPADPASAAAQASLHAKVAAEAGSSDSSTTTAPAVDDAAAQAQANTDAAVPATTTGTFTPDLAPALGRPDIDAAASPGTSSAPAASSGTAEGKADLAGLPNFGIAAAGAVAPSVTGSASATASAASAVPIAGLAVAISARAQAGINQFDIRLDPPELGRIDVRLGVDRDGQVTSHISVDRPDTLQLLQSQQPQLERALEQAGLKTADNGLQFSLRDQSFTGQNNGGGGNAPSYAPNLVIPDNELAAVSARQIYNRFGLGTGVDIRV
jgi:flagellar hook-length control protein FliK